MSSWVQFLASLSGLAIRLGSCVAAAIAQAAATAPIWPLAWDPPHAVGAALKKDTHTKKVKKKKRKRKRKRIISKKWTVLDDFHHFFGGQVADIIKCISAHFHFFNKYLWRPPLSECRPSWPARTQQNGVYWAWFVPSKDVPGLRPQQGQCDHIYMLHDSWFICSQAREDQGHSLSLEPSSYTYVKPLSAAASLKDS